MSVHRRGGTVVECLTVAAIIATMIALLIPAFTAMRANEDGQEQTDSSPPKATTMWTVQHDGHWWIVRGEHFVHHLDCPCRLGRAELSE